MRILIIKQNTLAFSLIIGAVILISILSAVNALAAPNPQINYQGKLTASTSAAVSDGLYSMVFKLYTAPTGGSPIWTESDTSTHKIQVTNGLFSVMLGSTTPLTSVNFNQPLYLGVTIGSDSEMTPRKILGTVPAAFIANHAVNASTSDNATTFGNIATTSFLRSDQADTASGLLTFTGGIISNGASSTITNLTTLTATTTTLYISGKLYDNSRSAGSNGYVLKSTGSGFQWVATSTLGIGGGATTFLGLTDTPSSYNTGRVLYESGSAVTDSSGLTFASSILSVPHLRATASSTIGDGTGAGGLTISGGATTTGNAYFEGNVGIGINNLSGLTLAVGQNGGSASAADSFDDESKIASLTDVVESSSSIALAVYTFSCGTDTVVAPDGLTYATVVGEDGNCWFATNLGTTHVATAYNDYQAYGSLFQWGRLTDGHELRTCTSSTSCTTTNGTTGTLSTTDNPGTSLFITNGSSPYDWRNPQNNNLWQSSGETNNVCPTGWHVPTQSEWAAEVTAASITNYTTAYSSNLKLTAGGYRDNSSGAQSTLGSGGYYWSSGVSGTDAYYLYFNSSGVYPALNYNRAFGFSVRCTQD